ncbi:unnamed protein product [Withania somnifera]
MSLFFLLHLLVIVVISFAVSGEEGNDCRKSSCSGDSPSIHFPFRLQHQPEHCGYPGFELSCYNNMTLLALSNSLTLIVDYIDYVSQHITLRSSISCLLNLLHFNFSASPFLLSEEIPLCNFSIFSCFGIQNDDIGCPATTPDSRLFALSNREALDYLPLTKGCKKIEEIPSAPCSLDYYDLSIKWLNPKCGSNKYTTQLRIQCLDRRLTTIGSLKELLVAGGVLGIALLGIIVMTLYVVYSSNRTQRENQARVEKFLEDYRAFRPTRYSYAVIKKITNLFQEILGEGAYGTVYKGTLSNEIHVAVKVLNDSNDDGQEFINEVAAMGKIHHVNVVRLVGFCADGFRRALVFEYLPNQSLDKLIFSPNFKDNITLDWKKLHDIAMGIAKGLQYLHQGCDQQILHFDIKPQNIMLDHNWNPKISDFGLAKLCSKEKSVVTMTEARGTMGYIAPEVLSSNFGKASHKSDVYSFGMMLLEMVGGRKNFDANANTSQMNFPEWIHQRLNQGEELKIRIEEDDDIIIIRKLAIIGLWCIQWNATDRPSIKVVIQMLEGDGGNLTVPPPLKARNTHHVGPSTQELTVISEQE